MLQIRPARLKQEAKQLIINSALTSTALARSFGVKEEELQNGLDGAPSTALIVGISRATGWPLDRISTFKTTQSRPPTKLQEKAA